MTDTHHTLLHLLGNQERDLHRLFVVQSRIDLAAIIAGEVCFRKIAGTASAFRHVFAGEFQASSDGCLARASNSSLDSMLETSFG